MAGRVRVCRTDDVPEGEMRAFDVDGLAVAVLVSRVAGVFHATSGMCPHEDVELIDGTLDGLQVSCPGHGYCFDVRSGACVPDKSLRLPVYRCWARDGDVWIELIG